MTRILITGAAGQIGTELTIALRKKYGAKNVLATDIKEPKDSPVTDGAFELLDALDAKQMCKYIRDYKINHIYHLSAMLSATAEQYPRKGWDLNMLSLLNVLELSREEGIKRVFWPSSIAVFGKGAKKVKCEQYEVQKPATVYGISKSAGELWCNYYFEKYGIDVRSLRYPGLISYKTLPGGGTTDYAVDIFFKAVAERKYTCYLKEGTRLPMMYMDDAIRATLELMEANKNKLSVRTSYNLSGVDFTPAALAASIRERIGEFEMSYAPDFRQAIAESWPGSIDDYYAQKEWNWKPKYNLERITKEMLTEVSSQRVNEYYL
ncbi:MAG: NAD-dependent epimerase/dehydratase family protein [Chitinophagaceae bacterium]|nr:NAD-dependent epimerase/dehydratase family protein [Chitinophagaceae bacterium]